MTGPDGYFRASHADRERVVDILKAGFREGRLTEDELRARAAQVLGSRTYAELAVVTADIPGGVAGPPGAQLMPEPGRRPANLTPFLCGVGVVTGIPVILLAMGIRLGNQSMAGIGGTLFVVEFLIFILAGLVALGAVADARMRKRRAAAQLPPRPGPPGTCS
jgi:hypothetical protein